MKRVLYLHRDPSFARFIRDDFDILRSKYLVDDVRVEANVRTAGQLARAALYADLVYFWWGDLSGLGGATIASILRKPSIMITGGYDVADVPSIRYGLRYHRWKKHLPPIVLGMATHIVANAQFSREGVIRDYGVEPSRIEFIPHGFDGNAITPGDVKKEPRVLTCSLITEGYIPYKGLDTFVRAARLLPEVPFVHAGPVKEASAMDRLRAMAPDNVTFMGFLSEADLLHEMRRATVYAQLSAHEGFGVALAEAMLAGATPVVTREGAIPEVAGPIAEYVPYGDAEETARGIARALAAPRGQDARARIAREFPLSRRRDGILRIVESLVGP
jgi:glycosyltransferase involved in cell wall biosynthesis